MRILAEQKFLITQQKAWLADRDEKCKTDVACLRSENDSYIEDFATPHVEFKGSHPCSLTCKNAMRVAGEGLNHESGSGAISYYSDLSDACETKKAQSSNCKIGNSDEDGSSVHVEFLSCIYEFYKNYCSFK